MPEPTDDYYGGQPGGDAAAPKPAPKDGEDDETGMDSALLPKSLFGQQMPEVGAMVQLKVEHIYEDEVEVSVAGEADGKKSTMDTATDAFDKMANPDQSGAEPEE